MSTDPMQVLHEATKAAVEHLRNKEKQTLFLKSPYKMTRDELISLSFVLLDHIDDKDESIYRLTRELHQIRKNMEVA